MINLFQHCTQENIRRAERLCDRGAVTAFAQKALEDGTLCLEGKTTDLFQFVDYPSVTLGADGNSLLGYRCSCPTSRMSDQFCEHCAALVLTAGKQPLQAQPQPAAPAPSEPQPAEAASAPAQNPAARWQKPRPAHSLEDVIGMDHFLQKLRPNLSGYTDMGGILSVKQRYLFYGPSGCGKTYLMDAYAAALEDQGITVLRLVPADVISAEPGQTEKNLEDFFAAAVSAAPCAVLAEDLDVLCPDRLTADTKEEWSRTNAFLRGFGAFCNLEKDAVFIGTLHDPLGADPILFDKLSLVTFPLPDPEARAAFFSRKLQGMALDGDFDVSRMAEQTENASFRDLQHLCDAISERMTEEQVLTPAVFAEALEAAPLSDKRMEQAALLEFMSKYEIDW